PRVRGRLCPSGAEFAPVGAAPAVRLLHWRGGGPERPGIGSASAALLLPARGGGGRRDVRLGRASLGDHVLGGENASRLEQVASDASADHRRDDEQPDLREPLGAGAGADKGRPKSTRRGHRRAGDVDAEKMQRDEREADCKSGDADRRASLGDAEDADQKQERRNHFIDERGADTVLSKIARSPTILPETAIPSRRLSLENE